MKQLLLLAFLFSISAHSWSVKDQGEEAKRNSKFFEKWGSAAYELKKGSDVKGCPAYVTLAYMGEVKSASMGLFLPKKDSKKPLGFCLNDGNCLMPHAKYSTPEAYQWYSFRADSKKATVYPGTKLGPNFSANVSDISERGVTVTSWYVDGSGDTAKTTMIINKASDKDLSLEFKEGGGSSTKCEFKQLPSRTVIDKTLEGNFEDVIFHEPEEKDHH